MTEQRASQEALSWLHRHARNVGGCWFMLIGSAPYRDAYARFVGRLEAGCEIHHKCGNGRCVNPDHLEQTTHEGHQKRHWGTDSHTYAGPKLSESELAQWRSARDAYYKSRPIRSFEMPEEEQEDEEIGFVWR